MIRIILSSTRLKETGIILNAFEQYGYDIVNIEVSHENFIKSIKADPSIFLIDIPYSCEKELGFIKMIRSNHSNKDKLIFGYGPEDVGIKSRFFDKALFDYYFDRPIKFSKILKVIKEKLPEKAIEIEENLNAIREDADIEMLRNSTILPSVKLNTIVLHASNFLAFPFTLPKVLAISNDDTSNAGELAKTIETDPVIAALVLKTANTVFYSPIDHRITRMRDAVVRIGFNETRRIVLCIEVMKLFEDTLRNVGFDRTRFWLHSISVAVATEIIFSRGEHKALAEHAFLTGLLHDLGTIVLDEFLPDIFRESLEETLSSAGEFSSVFCSKMGFEPYKITKEFMKKWNFHPLILSGIQFRSFTDEDLKTASDETYLKASLQVAHTLVKSLALGQACDLYVDNVPNSVFSYLDLKNGIPDFMVEKIYFNVKEMCQFLNITPEKALTSFIDCYCDKTLTPLICFYSVGKELFSPHFTYIRRQEYPSKKLFTFEQLENFCEYTKLLILSLDDSSPEAAVEFLESDKFQNRAVENTILITAHTAYVKEKSTSDTTVVMPREIDIRLFGRILSTYFAE